MRKLKRNYVRKQWLQTASRLNCMEKYRSQSLTALKNKTNKQLNHMATIRLKGKLKKYEANNHVLALTSDNLMNHSLA